MKFKRLPAHHPRPAGHGINMTASDWAAAPEPIKAESFTIVGEAVVLGLEAGLLITREPRWRR